MELAKWYHPAVSPVKRLRQENEEPETVGHPPQAAVQETNTYLSTHSMSEQFMPIGDQNVKLH